ncbi:nanos homolog 3-like [Ctenocephalides felis]|uniref:nanos homolog 3-like n=1 Tax=Ctenocephalides felis TaxID=7515 RepID=UPI000E6E2978|nr:nanos homolog 3-like [Ctenocephalides felis]XP_026478663.1 nanos homolog 3-like [Ctenocephalides felis]
MACYYPYCPSLQEEFVRLFAHERNVQVVAEPIDETDLFIHRPTRNEELEKIWEDFRNNGQDMEYCPDEEKTDILLETLKEKNNNVVFSNIFTIGRPKKRKQKPTKVDKICVFCKNNGCHESVYNSHVLKDRNGNVTCPFLREYECPICHASGNNAHTIRFCPSKKIQVTLESSDSDIDTISTKS